jgi:hypothetical protein
MKTVMGRSQKWNHNPQARDRGRGCCDIIINYLENREASTAREKSVGDAAAIKKKIKAGPIPRSQVTIFGVSAI